MVFRIPSDLGEPGAGHHDAGRSDGFLVQSVEAGGVHRMGHGKIVSMNDEKLRIRRIAQAFGYSLILRARARSCEKQEHASAGILSKLHEKLKQPSLVANGNMAEAVTKVPRHSTGALVRSPSQSHFAGMVLSEFRRLEQIFSIAALMVYTQNPALMIWRTTKMKRSYFLLALGFFVLAPVRAQDPVIAPADNLIVDGVPKMPASLAETAGRYGSYRSANLADWHPAKREMLIATRFAETQKIHLLTQLAGGGWQPQDWSPDDKKILLAEELSINESYLWLVDAATGEKLELTPRNMTEKVSYGEGRFSKDGKGIYVTTDKDSEFHRLAYIDLATKQPQYLTTNIPWDVESFDVTQDGKMIAFMTDEEGVSVLHVMDTSMKKEIPLPKLPAGVMGSLRWHKNGHELGFSLNNARDPGDVYSLDVTNGKVERWTTSEMAVKTDRFPQAELVRWKSFDGKMISGFLYRPPATFTGKRPVLVVIHGGPEGQSQPTFLGRHNYHLK